MPAPFFLVEKSFKQLGKGINPIFPIWVGEVKRKSINPEGRAENFPRFRSLVCLLLGEKPHFLRLRLVQWLGHV